MSKIIAYSLALFLTALPGAAHAGLWGENHGVETTCRAMRNSLDTLVSSRCSSDPLNCYVNQYGALTLQTACWQLIDDCPNGVFYRLSRQGVWEIKCNAG